VGEKFGGAAEGGLRGGPTRGEKKCFRDLKRPRKDIRGRNERK
jgi:hypothetical protein